MKPQFRQLAACGMLVASMSLVTPAIADGRGSGGHAGGRGHGHGEQTRHDDSHDVDGWVWGLLGLGVILALAAPDGPPTQPQPAGYQPIYYPQPQVVDQPPRYVEPAVPAYSPPPPAPSYSEQDNGDGTYWWYRCSKPDGYYPYVKTCPSGWQRVSPTPPG